MIFFGDKLNPSLTEGLASELNVPINYPEVTVFADGERRIRLTQEVVDEEVVFVKTASETPSLDSYLIETAFLIDSVKRSGAKTVTGVIPYIPYSRADHVFRTGEAVPLEVVINLLEKSGLSKIIFVDPHTIKMPEMFSIEVKSLSALPLFAEKIKEIEFKKESAVIVSPDMGGLRRMEQISRILDDLPFASVEKERDYDNGSITASAFHGDIKKTCFIVDDMISSGKTMVQAIEKLHEGGAERIFAFATHPILSSNASEILQNSHVEKVFVTDALPIPDEKRFEKLEVISLSNLVGSAL